MAAPHYRMPFQMGCAASHPIVIRQRERLAGRCAGLVLAGHANALRQQRAILALDCRNLDDRAYRCLA